MLYDVESLEPPRQVNSWRVRLPEWLARGRDDYNNLRVWTCLTQEDIARNNRAFISFLCSDIQLTSSDVRSLTLHYLYEYTELDDRPCEFFGRETP